MNKNECTFTYINGDDWQAFYKNGKLIDQGPFYACPIYQFCPILEVDCLSLEITEYLEEHEEMPNRLEDLPGGMLLPSEYVQAIGGDWSGLYHLGELIGEGHSLTPNTPGIFSKLGARVEHREADCAWLENRGEFPDDLQDVILAPGQKPLIPLPKTAPIPKVQIPKKRKRLSPLAEPPKDTNLSI